MNIFNSKALPIKGMPGSVLVSRSQTTPSVPPARRVWSGYARLGLYIDLWSVAAYAFGYVPPQL